MKGRFLGILAALTLLFSFSFATADAQYKHGKKRGHTIEQRHPGKHFRGGHYGKIKHRHGIKGRHLTLRERRAIERYHKQAIREHKLALKRNKEMRRMQTHYGFGR